MKTKAATSKFYKFTNDNSKMLSPMLVENRLSLNCSFLNKKFECFIGEYV